MPTPNRPDFSKFSNRRPVRTAVAAALLVGTTLGGFAVGSFGNDPARAQSTAQAGAITPQMPMQRLPDFTGLVKQVKPAVVSITSILKADEVDSEDGGQDQGGQGGGGQQMPFPFPFPFQAPQSNAHRTIEARGSGFIISPDGYIVTNNHVVKGATSVTVTMDDGVTLPAKVVGRDPRTDLALLRVKPTGKLPYIELGESDDVEPGQWVIAVGNPFGLGGTVTAGIVSARGRDIGEGPYDSFLQIDAPINRGNSGGPLFTQDGKVVGVNTAILSPTGGSVGIGFAIPSDVVRNVVAQLKAHGKVTRGYLGVAAQQISPALAKSLSLPASLGDPPAGALVSSVTQESPAEKAGLKAGDVIISVNGQKVATPRDLAIKVASVVPDSDAKLTIVRNGATQTVTAHIANLGKDSGSPSAANGPADRNGSIGVSLSALTPDVRQQLGVDDSVHGVVVQGVRPDSAADQAGIRPGDIIVGVGNHAVSSTRDTVTAVHAALKSDQVVALRILRDGQGLFVAVSPNGSSGDGSGATSPGDDGGVSGDANGNGNGNQDDGGAG